MNKAKVTPDNFINFLVATPVNATAMEAQRTNPVGIGEPSHDAYTRLLHRLEPTSEAIWDEVKPEVKIGSGILVLDDTVLDKPYARKMDLVHRMWSGKHHGVVKGIDLLTLLWTDGDRHLPCDYRIYDKVNDGKSKNDHFGDLVDMAKERGFQPEYVLFDGWYSSLRNLKKIAGNGWFWLTRLKKNRRVNPDRSGNRPISECEISATGTVVHLENYGMVKVFRIISKDGTAEYWTTNNLEMDELTRLKLAEASWKIEEYHRGLKQVTNVERCQCRTGKAIRVHIGLALRAFLVFEKYCFNTGYNWVATKFKIVQEAVRAFRANPWFQAPRPSTA